MSKQDDNRNKRSRSKYDLHLHTCWSYDGVVEPEKYFAAASAFGVKYIAIAEHYNIDSQE